ncbi:MAG: hypothetical protein WCQ00_02455 [bacterium]
MNTLTKGSFRHIVFKDGDTWYAVALEFNIVESSDDPKLAFFNLLQAVSGYIESAKKIKGTRFHSLNQKTDEEYEKLWSFLNTTKKTNSSKSIKSPYLVNMYGVSKI